MRNVSEGELHALLVEDPEQAWRRFIDLYTPTILRFIEKAGVVKRDEALDVYVRVCEKLSKDDALPLRRRDPAKGSISAWLAVVVRHTVVDWVRSRAGRRRLFRAVKELDRVDRRVFELYYWEGLMPGEILEALGTEAGKRLSLLDVLSALDRIQEKLSHRQRSELLSLAARSQRPVSLAEHAGEAVVARDPRPDPNARLHARELAAGLNAALAQLDPEEAAILRLKYVEGLSLEGIQRALQLPALDGSRVRCIVSRLRSALSRNGMARSGNAIDELTLAED